MEVRALNTGLYPNGTRTGILPIDTRVIENLLFTNSLNPGIGLVNDYPRAREYRMPIMRLSEASGSSTNPDCFVPTERQINMAKGQVVGGVSPMSDIRFRGLARNAGRGDRSSQEELARQFDVVSNPTYATQACSHADNRYRFLVFSITCSRPNSTSVAKWRFQTA